MVRLCEAGLVENELCDKVVVGHATVDVVGQTGVFHEHTPSRSIYIYIKERKDT